MKIFLKTITLLTVLILVSLNLQNIQVAALVSTDKYIFDKDSGTITKYIGTETEIDIPEEIEGIKVIKVGYSAFQGIDITRVNIANSIEEIENEAFEGCTKLNTIKLPANLKYIGYAAFSNCTNLINVELPNSLTSINGRVFAGCKNLINISIPNSVEYIGNSAFEECINLKNIELSDSLTEIAGETFSDCYNLKDINLPDSITNIGFRAFKNCISLNTITIPTSVKTFSDNIFEGCTNLKTIILPNTIEEFAFNTFNLYNSLEKIYYKGDVSNSNEDELRNILENSALENARTVEVVLSPYEDVNNDGSVGILDLSLVCNLYNKTNSDIDYNINLDLNRDNYIDIFDIVLVSRIMV